MRITQALLLLVASAAITRAQTSLAAQPGTGGLTPGPANSAGASKAAETPMDYRMRLIEWNLTFDDPAKMARTSFGSMGDEAAFNIFRIAFSRPNGLTAKETLKSVGDSSQSH